jgi:hypothetical protein
LGINTHPVHPWFDFLSMIRNEKIARLPREIRDELNRRLREIFGRPPKVPEPPEPPEATTPDGSGSNPVKPGQTNFSNGHAPVTNPHDNAT